MASHGVSGSPRTPLITPNTSSQSFTRLSQCGGFYSATRVCGRRYVLGPPSLHDWLTEDRNQGRSVVVGALLPHPNASSESAIALRSSDAASTIGKTSGEISIPQPRMVWL